MISPRLQATILKELDLTGVALTDDMLASQVPGWDSLSHVRILMAIEKEYGIRFKTLEVMRLPDIGALQRLVDSKSSAAPR
jgi:acyl carrier protein